MDSKFDLASFWVGVFIGICGLVLLVTILFGVNEIDYVTPVPDACKYAEDLCYPEYEDGQWSIIQGER